jgi:hypothetical protein
VPPGTARAETIFAYYFTDTDGPRFLRFDSEAPGVTEDLPISGPPFASPTAADVRPATGELFYLEADCTYVGLPSCGVALLRVDMETAALERLDDLPIVPFASDVGVDPADYGFDFDPARDRIRITHAHGWNAEVSPSGDPSSIDSPLSPGIALGGLASSSTGQDQGTFYAIDSAGDRLYRLGGANGVPSPASGELTLVADLVPPLGELLAFDISPTGRAFVAGYRPEGTLGDGPERITDLHEIDLATGATTFLGEIGVPRDHSFFGAFAVDRAATGFPAQQIPAIRPMGVLAFALIVAAIAAGRLRSRRAEGSG